MASQDEHDRNVAKYVELLKYCRENDDDDDDDDDDDEGEFELGNDDDEEDDYEEEDDDEEDEYVWMKGTLSLHHGRLVYKGKALADSFELKSKQHPLHWNVHYPTITSPERPKSDRFIVRTIAMEGTFGNQSVQVDLTLTAECTSINGNSKAAPRKKGDDDDDDDEDHNRKMPWKQTPAASKKDDDNDDDEDAKLPSIPLNSSNTNNMAYRVFGKGLNSSKAFEFYGVLHPSNAQTNSVPLECQKRTVSLPSSTTAPAAAAAAKKRGGGDKDDNDDDDDDDADEKVDYDELIALHQDAGLSLSELRKRYNPTKDDRPRKKPARPLDDDSDEYGF